MRAASITPGQGQIVDALESDGGEEAGLCWAKGFCHGERASGVNGGQAVDVYVYVRKAMGVRVGEGRFAWLTGGLTSRASTR